MDVKLDDFEALDEARMMLLSVVVVEEKTNPFDELVILLVKVSVDNLLDKVDVALEYDVASDGTH